jgi:hypothetical protein
LYHTWKGCVKEKAASECDEMFSTFSAQKAPGYSQIQPNAKMRSLVDNVYNFVEIYITVTKMTHFDQND